MKARGEREAGESHDLAMDGRTGLGRRVGVHDHSLVGAHILASGLGVPSSAYGARREGLSERDKVGGNVKSGKQKAPVSREHRLRATASPW